jgi:hypothetical protein
VQQPTVNRQVHYVSYGSPLREDGSQAFSSQCRAAVITEVDGDNVGLCVINPTGLFFHPIADGGVSYDEGEGGEYAAGSWHWPERV